MARSETAAWHVVAVKVGQIFDLLPSTRRPTLSARNAEAIAVRLTELSQIARDMQAQLARGVHANPPLIIYGNPPKGAELMSRRVYAIEYQHAGDRQDYRHDCARGVSMFAQGDGTIILQRPDRRPLSQEFDV